MAVQKASTRSALRAAVDFVDQLAAGVQLSKRPYGSGLSNTAYCESGLCRSELNSPAPVFVASQPRQFLPGIMV